MEMKELSTIGFTDVSDLEEEALTLDPEEFRRQKLMEQKKIEAKAKAEKDAALAKKAKEEEEKKIATLKETSLLQEKAENQVPVSKEEQLEETFESEMM